jgi:hypothetical protein
MFWPHAICRTSMLTGISNFSSHLPIVIAIVAGLADDHYTTKVFGYRILKLSVSLRLGEPLSLTCSVNRSVPAAAGPSGSHTDLKSKTHHEGAKITKRRGNAERMSRKPLTAPHRNSEASIHRSTLPCLSGYDYGGWLFRGKPRAAHGNEQKGPTGERQPLTAHSRLPSQRSATHHRRNPNA